jgi:hypothetical protein
MCFVVCVGLKKSTWNKIGNTAGKVLQVGGAVASAVPGLGTIVGGVAVAGGGALISRSPVPTGKANNLTITDAANANAPNAGGSNNLTNATANTNKAGIALIVGGILFVVLMIFMVRR